jgi:hypothetical protein
MAGMTLLSYGLSFAKVSLDLIKYILVKLKMIFLEKS